MSEQELSHEELEAFREEFKGHLEEVLFIIGTGQESAFPVDTLSFGMREESEAELANPVRTVLRSEIYSALGISATDKPYPVNTYVLPPESDEGNYLVKVFEGSYENPESGETVPVFLHEVVGPTRELSWLVANIMDALPELQAPESES